MATATTSGIARMSKVTWAQLGHTLHNLHLLGGLGHAPTMKKKLKLDTLRYF